MSQFTLKYVYSLPRARHLVGALVFLALCLGGYKQEQWTSKQGYSQDLKQNRNSITEPTSGSLFESYPSDTHSLSERPLVAPSRDFTSHLPSEYLHQTPDAAFCEDRFGLQYLKTLSEHVSSQCTPGSAARAICFHSATEPSRVDSMCITGPASFQHDHHKWLLPCTVRDVPGQPSLTSLGEYWYSTGPGYLFDNYISLTNHHPVRYSQNLSSSSTPILLLKREGTTNLWHSLMEVFAATMTMDVLRIAQDPDTARPLFSEADFQDTRIVVADDMEDGPFWDILAGLSPQNITRLRDADPDWLASNRVILPIAGGGNPFWQGDWVVHDCHGSALLDVFVQRIYRIFGMSDNTASRRDIPVKLTYIDRTTKRKLLDQDAHVRSLRARFPDIDIQVVDFADYSIKDQIELARQTDVLVGVHGAGLTHAMFMAPGTAVVEIMPEQLNHKGFRNLAKLRRQLYFGTHGGESHAGADWHDADVTLELERYVDLIEAAVKSVYNEGLRNKDVN